MDARASSASPIQTLLGSASRRRRTPAGRSSTRDSWVCTGSSRSRRILHPSRAAGAPPPAIADLNAETGGHAMYSLHDPVHGLKAGVHHAGPEVDPEAEAAPDPAIVERIVSWVSERFPGIDPSPVEAETCLYTTTA